MTAKRTAKIEAWAVVDPEIGLFSIYTDQRHAEKFAANYPAHRRLVRLTEASDPSLAAEVRRLRKALGNLLLGLKGGGMPLSCAIQEAEQVFAKKPKPPTRRTAR